jgi:hypothetical protein
MTFLHTAWVKNYREATGQDQLGLRFFSETIYQDLLPHITNVTSRGRYFSFYPWLIRAVENQADNLRDFSLQTLIRRADCLLTLIGLYHYYIGEKGNQGFHDGFIGARKLNSVLHEIIESGEPVQLSQYAAEEESTNRYFKNKFGGLGQYYFGPLRDAGILAYNESGEIHYTKDRGQIIAEAFDEAIDAENFIDVLKNDWVTEEDLKSLLDFCPCLLSENTSEQNILIDFFFSRREVFQHPNWEKRKDSLILLLDFIQKSSACDLEIPLDSSGVHRFLSAAYTGAFNENLLWEVAAGHSLETRVLWRQYYAGELLSFAIQGLFWAGLTKVVEDDALIPSCRDYGYWFSENFISSVEELGGKSFTEAVEEIELNLAEIVDWEDENHEINLTRQLEQVLRDKRLPYKQEKVTALSIRILLSLAARWRNKENQPNFPVAFSKQQLSEYPINLTNFLGFSENVWREMNLDEWLAWLASKWGVETHLMIALRKLHQESLDTFKVYPSDKGLQVKEVVGDKTIDEVLMPGFTSPRLQTTLQILWDLGVVSVENERLQLTKTGESLLEEFLHG